MIGILQDLLNRFGFTNHTAERYPIRVFLLDDDIKRHGWFARRFNGDFIDVAEDVATGIEMLENNVYDAIFLDHDLLPEHYGSKVRDDERTGYAVAVWLASRPKIQPAATIVVHTRNADGAMRMVEELRRCGRNAEYVPFTFLEQKIKNYWHR